MTTSADYNIRHGGAGGGGAGGQSGNNTGSPGGKYVYNSYSYASNPSAGGEAALRQILGGAGGNGAAGSPGQTYGSGGNGGGGGGGGGAVGNGSVSTSVSVKIKATVTGRVSAKATVYPPRSGAGGTGGQGGKGADGCIILYYGAQREVDSGPLVTVDKKIFRDKFNRLMVV